jgi:ADP-ribose pyrophosphatase YjhB (NUDIX family)
MSVTSPTFMSLPPLVAVVVFAEDFFPPPPQPAAMRSMRTPRTAADRFIPVLSGKVCDYGAKTVSERTTRHPTPAHVTLAVVLQVRNGPLQALLWQRAREPFKGRWSLPGGYLAVGDTLEESIRRHLAEKVDVRELSQLETLSDPKRSPREWQLATAYLGLVPSDIDPELPGDTDWHPVDDLPPLAFDHGSIVLAGRERLRAKLSYTNLGFALAPAEFTISELRDLYAAALGHDVSATNLQRVLLRREVLESTGRQRASGPTGGRPGSLFRFRTPELEITDQFAVLRPPGPARLPVS